MIGNKKTQKIVVSVVAVLVAFGLIGSTVLFYLTQDISGYGGSDPRKIFESDIQYFTQLTQQAPDVAGNWTDLGNAYYGLGRSYREGGDLAKGSELLAKAAEAYEKSLAIDPENPAVRVDMAVAYYYSDQLDPAEKNFQQAIADFPNYPNAHLNYGIFLWQARQNPQGAIDRWNELLKTNPPQDVADQANTLIAIAQQELGSTGKVDWSKSFQGQ